MPENPAMKQSIREQIFEHTFADLGSASAEEFPVALIEQLEALAATEDLLRSQPIGEALKKCMPEGEEHQNEGS